MICNRAAARLQPGRAAQHHVPRGTWCCHSSISAAACEKHLLSTTAEQRRIHGGCVSTLRAQGGVPNEIFDQIGYLFVYSFREDTATECRSLTARCVDRSICSEAEPRTFSCWHRQAPLGACAVHPEDLARPRAVSSVARQGHAPQNKRGMALSMKAASRCSMSQETANNILKSRLAMRHRKRKDQCTPIAYAVVEAVGSRRRPIHFSVSTA